MSVVAEEQSLPNGLAVRCVGKANCLATYQEIFEEQVYLRHGITFNNGDCIFDIGANIGLFLVQLNTILDRASVFCFEPIPAMFAALEENAKRYDRLGAKVFHCGLSDHEGTATFTYYPRMCAGSTMYPEISREMRAALLEQILDDMRKLPNRPLRWLLASTPRSIRRRIAEAVYRYYHSSQQVTCELRTVSQIIREYDVDRIDLLKVDAESAEIAILSGVDPEHWPRIRQVVVEMHHGDAVKQQTVEMLEREGFTVSVDSHLPILPHISQIYAKRR